MAGEIVGSVEMLRRLVAFDTTSRNSNLALIEYVQKYLQEHGIDSKLVPSEDGKKANLFATVGPNVKDGVVLSGHTDVVPVDGQAQEADPLCALLRRGGGLHWRPRPGRAHGERSAQAARHHHRRAHHDDS